mgnify:CR=1 FL=1
MIDGKASTTCEFRICVLQISWRGGEAGPIFISRSFHNYASLFQHVVAFKSHFTLHVRQRLIRDISYIILPMSGTEVVRTVQSLISFSMLRAFRFWHALASGDNRNSISIWFLSWALLLESRQSPHLSMPHIYLSIYKYDIFEMS